tara:strand:+ start:349 stop:831 length:483 start_codon:yes stop_codon:yes gene_type:complete
MNKAIQFQQQVIKPVLAKMQASSVAAEELLLGTAVQESLNFKYRRQMGNGPARGFYQMEPATHDDIWNNYLKYNAQKAELVLAFLSSPTADKISELEHNDEYATAMARVHYMRVREALPKQGDVQAQANYWKQYFNTPLGKGKPAEYVEKWQHYVMTDEA